MSLSIIAPTITLGLVDGADLSVHGRTTHGSLDLQMLGRTLTFLAQHG